MTNDQTVTQALESVTPEDEAFAQLLAKEGPRILRGIYRDELIQLIARHRTAHSGEGRSNGAGEDRIEEAARAAMREHEIARTDVVRPVNGSAAYTVVIFHGRRIEFHDDDWTIEQHRDAGSSKAATYAQAINGGLFDLAKGAATAALSAPQGEVERLARNIRGWLEWHRLATADDDCRYLNCKGWDDAEALASTSMGLLAALAQPEAGGER